MKGKSNRLTGRTMRMTEGSPFRLLLAFAVPMLIGNVFQQLYNLVDSIIVGRFVGAEALAAVGTTGSVTFLFFSVSNGIASGGGIVVSQFFGAGDREQVKKAIANAAYIMFGAAFVMSIVAYAASAGVLRLMGTPEDIFDTAVMYMRMNCIGVPLVAVYNYASSMLRALGDSRTPLYFLIFSSFLNVVLDIVCVYYLDMGVFGAALATIIAQVVSGVGCMLYAIRSNDYFRMEKQHLGIEKRIILQSVRLGIPLALQFGLIAISTTALQRVVNSFGTTAIAAFTATSRVEQLAHQPYGSLSTALSTYSGQNFGANRMDRVQLGFRQSMMMMGVFTMALMLFVMTCGGFVMQIFVEDPEVIALGGTALRITGCFYFFLGLINVTRGMLNGVGDAMFAFINGIVELIGRIVVPLVMIRIPGMGVWGLWWAAGLVWMISSLFCMGRYLSWKRKVARQLNSEPTL